jgi:uncharacterized membrane protein (UPF0127 family)
MTRIRSMSTRRRRRRHERIGIRIVKRFNTVETRKKGLMFIKTPLDKDAGALFMYPPDEKKRPSRVWMKNTYIPLDAIVIDKKRRVLQTVKNMKPLSEHSHTFRSKKAAGFIETNAGFVNKHKIRIGTKLHFYRP